MEKITTKLWYVYVLLCNDKSLYTGITNDLDHRLAMHRSGKGAKYVRAHLPFTMVYHEVLPDKSAALKREAEIKRWPREKKLVTFAISL